MEKGMTAKVAHDTITAVRKIKAGYWYFKVVNGMGGPYFDRETYRLRETAYPHGLKPITARVWAKLPPNKRAYIIKTLPSCGRA
jgi:hypothetical protein